jgi:hypothetical protein
LALDAVRALGRAVGAGASAPGYVLDAAHFGFFERDWGVLEAVHPAHRRV